MLLGLFSATRSVIRFRTRLILKICKSYITRVCRLYLKLMVFFTFYNCQFDSPSLSLETAELVIGIEFVNINL